jgi:2-methylisocitrate lyase-like PEP mutase family enzyme
MPTSKLLVVFGFLLSLTIQALQQSPPERLRLLLTKYEDPSIEMPLLLPCAYDGLTARLVTRAGFEATFMTGFGVSAVRGHPDTQLVSSHEMLESAHQVAEGLMSAAQEMGRDHPIPCIADGDTGYGNAINVKRTIWGYARAGMAGVMMEDQVQPKRCGHVAGKAVVGIDEAVQRIKAACDARDEYAAQYGISGPLILARTDALKSDGMDAALDRLQLFRDAGCDMTFLEAPRSVEEMERYCNEISGPKLANMLEQGETPVLPPRELKRMGYTMAAYPLTLLSASIKAMEESLIRIKEGIPTDDIIVSFSDSKDVVGFTRYASEEDRYRTD